MRGLVPVRELVEALDQLNILAARGWAPSAQTTAGATIAGATGGLIILTAGYGGWVGGWLNHGINCYSIIN